MRRELCWLLAVSAVTVGCGPSLSSLVEHKHYREAICGANDGTDGDRAGVANAVALDSELYVHVQTLTEKELTPLLGASTRRVMERADVVRVRVRSNILPIDRLDVSVSFRNDGGHASAAPVAWDTLAWLTEETLPSRRWASTYATPQNALRGLAGVVTLGFSLLFTEFRPGEMQVDAPRAEYEKRAPLATAMHDAMADRGCRRLDLPLATSVVPKSGRDCEGFYILERATQGRWVLVAEQRFYAARVGEPADVALESEEERCVVRHVAEVDLGDARGLTARAKALFGSRMRRVSAFEPSP